MTLRTIKMKQQLLAMFLGITLAYGGALHENQTRPDSYAVACDPGGCSGTGGSIRDSVRQDTVVVTCDPGGCSGTGGAR